jgi:hypothetical protein
LQDAEEGLGALNCLIRPPDVLLAAEKIQEVGNLWTYLDTLGKEVSELWKMAFNQLSLEVWKVLPTKLGLDCEDYL